MSNRRQVLFSSDWHIGHKKVIEFSNRPFIDIEHMHRVLVNNYNSTAGPKTTGYFLGDMGLCGSDMMTDVIRKLNGIKILILGNHDKKHNAMYNIGFDAVLNAADIWVSGERVSMSHCPKLGVYRENTEGMRGGFIENWHGETREKSRQYTVKDDGQFHLHGHIHSPNSGKSKKILGRQFDVGVDANGYRPVHISAIESWIAKTKEMERNGKK